MALTRKFLSALGIESDKVDEIIQAHTDTVDGLKQERDAAKNDAEKFKADAEKLSAVQKELADLKDSDLESKYETLEADYNKLKDEYAKYKSDVSEKETRQGKEKAFRGLLKDIGISEKRIESILKVSDVDSVKVDKDGKIEGADELSKSLKEEWADFIVKEGQHGVNTATPPDNDNGGRSHGESRAAKIAAEYHKNLYGEAKKED